MSVERTLGSHEPASVTIVTTRVQTLTGRTEGKNYEKTAICVWKVKCSYEKSEAVKRVFEES